MASSAMYYDENDTVNFKCSESIITCQICMDIFESPRILPCQHTFCKKCVFSLLTKHCLDDNGISRKNTFPCPNCRRECKIRQKGKYSIEEHMKCFPESLLLKTLLESVEETPNCQYGEDRKKSVKERETFSNDGNEKITQVDDEQVKKQSSINILFYLKLLQFIRLVNVLYSNSLKLVSKSTYIHFFEEFLAIPYISKARDIDPHPVLDHINNQNDAIDEANILEDHVISVIEMLGLNIDEESNFMFVDAQTQTDDDLITFDLLRKTVIKILLLKNSSLILWLERYLCGKSQKFEEADLSICFTLPYRKIRYWILFFKLFDIFTMLYVARQSLLWSFILLMICYVIFLVFFKRIMNYVDGGLYISNSIPLFPIFLMSLNFFLNLNGLFLYSISAIHMNCWLICKLFFFEFVPSLSLAVTAVILILCNKKHLMLRYGPYLELQ